MQPFQVIIGHTKIPLKLFSANPFDIWLLCGVNGSCTDISPLAMLQGGSIGNASFEWNSKLQVSGKNVSFAPTLVCVWPPFVFVVFNDSVIPQNGTPLNCDPHVCFYALCWNATEHPLVSGGSFFLIPG